MKKYRGLFKREVNFKRREKEGLGDSFTNWSGVMTACQMWAVWSPLAVRMRSCDGWNLTELTEPLWAVYCSRFFPPSMPHTQAVWSVGEGGRVLVHFEELSEHQLLHQQELEWRQSTVSLSTTHMRTHTHKGFNGLQLRWYQNYQVCHMGLD